MAKSTDKPEASKVTAKKETKAEKQANKAYKKPATDPLEMVVLRNEFYRDNYRKAMAVLSGCVVAILILLVFVFYFAIHRPAPVYFATSNGWHLEQLTPLSKPVVNDAQVLQWATNAVDEIYNFNFVNYRQHLQDISRFFTDDGYQQFMQALNNSNNLKTVIAEKLVLSTVVTRAPVVVAEGELSGRYAWRIQMPIMISLQSSSEQLSQNVVVSLLVVRASTLDKPEGLAISQYIEAPDSAEQN